MKYFHQVHSGNLRASLLRGAYAFHHLAVRERGMSYTGTYGWMWAFRPGDKTLLFVTNPVVIETFEKAKNRPDVQIVADVTFPIDRPDLVIGGLLIDDPLFALENQIARDEWGGDDPEGNLARLCECVKLADAVTTPHPEWMSPLTLLNQNAYVLRDLPHQPTVEQVEGFADHLALIWESIP